MYTVLRHYRGEAVPVAECDTPEQAREFIREANDREKTVQYWIQYPRDHANYHLPVAAMQ